MTRDFAYRIKDVADLSSIDLSIEATDNPHWTFEAYGVTVGKEGLNSADDVNWEEPNGAELLICLDTERFGVAWGADADWYDIPTPEDKYIDLSGMCLDYWLNKPEQLTT
jgi:hypothetical protein